ncbi:ATP-dependent zinc protease [Shewanella youngdeokensis]|uniref:ATP-dependent zinc protease n=1 Tax=Shewanella youngdeokensis TaxID=2999068 RepID=A0ABZ0K455_9GAMM|nr:ATP-dependent zinc protease [Shewanella sp. DAU334]
MLKQTIFIAVITTVLSGCASTQEDNQPKPVDIATLQASLNQQQSSIINAIDACKSIQTAGITQLASQIDRLNDTMQTLNTKPQEVEIVPVVAPLQCPPSPLDGKFILGAIEHVYVDELKASFNTRIDTGAESSSIDARNIILFERDGTQWVRFDVLTNGAEQPAQTFESKVERFVRIKEADNKTDRRPVIHAHLEIGQYKAETDLNLSDRSHLEYPMLLGRKFMQDIAVVDVGETFIHGKK